MSVVRVSDSIMRADWLSPWTQVRKGRWVVSALSSPGDGDINNNASDFPIARLIFLFGGGP